MYKTFKQYPFKTCNNIIFTYVLEKRNKTKEKKGTKRKKRNALTLFFYA